MLGLDKYATSILRIFRTDFPGDWNHSGAGHTGASSRECWMACEVAVVDKLSVVV